MRASVAVLTICPKSAPTVMPGTPTLARLKALKTSARNWSAFRSVTLNALLRLKSKLIRFGPRMTPMPELPKDGHFLGNFTDSQLDIESSGLIDLKSDSSIDIFFETGGGHRHRIETGFQARHNVASIFIASCG